MMSWNDLILAGIAAEALTEIWVSSELTEPLRDKVGLLKSRVSILARCGYCVSVWAAMFLCIDIFIVKLIVQILVVHRMSNVFHEVIYRFLNRMPLISVHNIKEDLNEEPEQYK